MPQILDGRIVRDKIALKLKREISKFKQKPLLAIIQVGDKAESSAYIKQKKIFADKIGVRVRHLKFPEKVSHQTLCREIEKLNKDKSVNGIILQLPVPKHLDGFAIIREIDSKKDVDGLTPKSLFTPATARGVLTLLDFYKIKIPGKQVVVVGRSKLVGEPTALAFLNRNATVAVAHKQTKNLSDLTKSADILVVAIGDPKFINKRYVKRGQVVVDVGINVAKKSLKEEILTGKKYGLVGDVDFNSVKSIVKAISPVPGGVGAMTVASLFENLVEACKAQSKA